MMVFYAILSVDSFSSRVVLNEALVKCFVIFLLLLVYLIFDLYFFLLFYFLTIKELQTLSFLGTIL